MTNQERAERFVYAATSEEEAISHLAVEFGAVAREAAWRARERCLDYLRAEAAAHERGGDVAARDAMLFHVHAVTLLLLDEGEK